MRENRQKGTSGEYYEVFGEFFGEPYDDSSYVKNAGALPEGPTFKEEDGTFGGKKFTPRNLPHVRGTAPNESGYSEESS